MNYLKELKAFRDWLLLNDLNTSAIALWHTLMAINNMTGWKERFNAPNSVVEKLTGLSKQGLVNARKKLIDHGLIEYEKGKKGRAPVYKMKSLVNHVDQYIDQSIYQYNDQLIYQSDTENLTIPKHKHKQKQKQNNNPATTNARKSWAKVYDEIIPDPINETQAREIDRFMRNGMEEDLICYAIEQSAMYNKPYYPYIHSILERYKNDGIKTREQALVQSTKKLKVVNGDNKNSYRKRSQRRDTLPEWIVEQEQQNNRNATNDDPDVEKSRQRINELLKELKG